MPLTEKGKTIKAAMKKQYGAEKGEDVFYASQQKGTITGTHKSKKHNPTSKDIKSYVKRHGKKRTR